METNAHAEAALPSTGDETDADRIVALTASTDPHKAMADIAQQRAETLRRTKWRSAAQAVFILSALAAGLVFPRFREHSLAAAPASGSAPLAATTNAAIAPAVASAPIAPTAIEQVAPGVAAPEDPAARCENQFKAHSWRLAIESCNAAFDAAPSSVLAMRIAHAYFSRGDAAGAGTWAQNALELGSTDPDTYLLIGHAQQAAGKRRKAVAAYRRYLELAPRGWHAARLRTLVD
jgi:tetratricopeptide (TPR) repeat protein